MAENYNYMKIFVRWKIGCANWACSTQFRQGIHHCLLISRRSSRVATKFGKDNSTFGNEMIHLKETPEMFETPKEHFLKISFPALAPFQNFSKFIYKLCAACPNSGHV